jgi:hypothetical protein
MSDYAADDFEFIRRRLKEIEDETGTECPICNGSGWEVSDDLFGIPATVECSVCGNPHGFPRP